MPDAVDDIVVEFGDAFYQPMMDRFVTGQPVNDADLRLAWRNTTVSPLDTWDAPVYEQFFRTVRAANAVLPPGKRMRVLLGDPPIDWPKITKSSQVGALPSRDGYAASLVQAQVLGKGRRALLCYGMVHLFRPVPQPHLPPNVVSIIEQQTGERVYVIADLVPVAGDPGGLGRKLAPYARNTVIPAAGSWLGSFDAGGIGALKLLRHGKVISGFCGVPLRSLIDAGLCVGQPADLTGSCPNPAIFLDPAYWAELQRRNALTGDAVDLASYRQEQPAQFPLLEVAPSTGCGQPASASKR